jgi:small basic protein (TIGR04137 family)
MAQHRSLKSSNKITARRNVLKRFERIEVLKKQGRFKDGQRVFGLPKTKPE